MSLLEDSLTRLLARAVGRALPSRQTSALADDPANTIGIATIKIVTEEQIQAIAYGRIGEPPRLIARHDPIARDVADLVPFAEFLGEIADRSLAGDGQLRVWVPHSGTVEALDILGHRYWRNQTAPAEVVRMGVICRIMAHENTVPGQQVVADAASVVRSHFITGQAPIEDGHLGALLAWLDPGVTDPLAVARERIRLPASGILPNTPDRPDDDRVDRLRRVAKNSSGTERDAALGAMERILREAVLREWRLMIEARAAFLSLGLPAIGLSELVGQSHDRIAYALANGHFPARQPHRIAIQLDQMKSGQQLIEGSELESDETIRRRARREGRAIQGRITRIDQTRRNFKPCWIEVETNQSIVRSRRDDKIRIVGTKVTGVIRNIEARSSTGTRLRIEITNGVRSTAVLSLGGEVEIVDQGFGHVRYEEFRQVKDRAPWIFFGDAAPTLASRPPARESPLSIARARRIP